MADVEKEKSGDVRDAKSLKNESNAALGSRTGTGKFGKLPSANTESKDNPSADLRNMRRIIAEDSEWNLATVPLLVDICISYIVDNFESKI